MTIGFALDFGVAALVVAVAAWTIIARASFAAVCPLTYTYETLSPRSRGEFSCSRVMKPSPIKASRFPGNWSS